MSFSNHIQRSISCDNSNSCQKASTSEQLSSTAKVFCEAVNQIVKSYLVNYDENNIFQTINLSFAQKVIKKTKISFSQLVVTLVYLNRYYKCITSLEKHIPGHEEAIIPSLSHVVLLCVIQAERYITDVPHKLSWWANVCAGQTKSIDIDRWQRDFFDTISYKLYVHPEKDYNIFKFQIKRLAARLFQNSVNMPAQFRRSINLGSGSQPTPTSASSSNLSNRIPSQPNVILEVNNTTTTTEQPTRILLSPLYSGRSNTSIILNSGQTNMVSSPLVSVHSDNGLVSNSAITINQTNSNLNVPIINVTNTHLTSSPVELNADNNSMINQTRSPNSIYTNSQHSFQLDTHSQLQNTSPLPPSQNPNNLMVHSNMLRSPNRRTNNSTTTINSLLVLSNNENNSNSPTTSIIKNREMTQSPSDLTMTSSPVQMTTIISSPLDVTSKSEDNEDSLKTTSQALKRKRSYYGEIQMPSVALKAAQGVKRPKISMTISPEEIDYQPRTPNSRPLEENNNKENKKGSNLGFQNKKSSLRESHRLHDDNQNFQSIDKGKNEDTVNTAGTSSHFFRISEESLSSTDVVKNSFLNHLETIPSSITQNDNVSLELTNTVNNEETIVSSLLLASNNSTSLNLIPVSPPLTPI